MTQRPVSLEKKSAEEGVVLTEAQVQALERKKHDDEAYGEIEAHHPGYLGSQGTFYVADSSRKRNTLVSDKKARRGSTLAVLVPT